MHSNKEKVAKKREMCLLMQGGGGETATLQHSPNENDSCT